MKKQIKVVLRGQGYPSLDIPVTIEHMGKGIEIRPEGYGDHGTEDGYGCPLYVEVWEGCLRVVAWPDINKADPIIIDLEGARERNRREEVIP